MASGNSLVLKDAQELSSAFAKVGGAVTPERTYALWAGASMTEQEQPDIEFAFITDAVCRQEAGQIRRRTQVSTVQIRYQEAGAA
jgi:hypothetical protein